MAQDKAQAFNNAVAAVCAGHPGEHVACPHGIVMCSYWMDVAAEDVRAGKQCGIACVSR
jgi:hypothetical protein